MSPRGDNANTTSKSDSPDTTNTHTNDDTDDDVAHVHSSPLATKSSAPLIQVSQSINDDGKKGGGGGGGSSRVVVVVVGGGGCGGGCFIKFYLTVVQGW